MIQTFARLMGKRFIGGLIKQFIAIAITMTLVLAACSSPPKAQVQNNASNNANVQFKAGNGGTVNINNVAPRTTSLTSEISKGSITVTSDVIIAKDTDAITAASGKLYTAVIDSTGTLKVEGK
jgi:ABC-type Fe3+-hydroxamate transport system substrate-binding protein